MKALRPQDIVVVLKLHVKGTGLTYAEMSVELGMSASNVHAAIMRLKDSRLISSSGEIRPGAVMNAIRASKYYFPASPGKVTRGLVTGIFGWEMLSDNEEGPLVWADPRGSDRGRSVEPLYRSVVFAAKQDENLHRLLGMVDSLRVGSARERTEAERLLKKEIGLQDD
jgi:DNA-binding transcriptional ArsR family regulator